MSLKKQLNILVMIGVLVIFSGTLGISIKNTQEYLNKQLKVHAQDTATSLGLSLREVLKNQDIAQADSMLDVIFDRGYYRQIYLDDINGKRILDKKVDVWVDNVPSWFVNMLPLETPILATEISSDWKPVATLGVSVHPGYAYEELWDVARYNLFWMSGLTFIIYMLVYAGLRNLLIPLDEIEKQALAIARKKFVTQSILPRARELRNVVVAMNKMSAKVEENFIAQADLIKKYQDLAYIDPLTGMLNRQAILIEMKAFILNTEEFDSAAFFIVHLSGIDGVNKNEGYAEGDKKLIYISSLINKYIKGDRFVCSRIGGSEFGVFIKNPVEGEAQKLIEKIINTFNLNNTNEQCRPYIGITNIDGSKSIEDYFAEADLALRQALSEKSKNWSIFREINSNYRVRTASEWKKLIEEALRNDLFELYAQSIQFFSIRDHNFREVLLRLNNEDQLIPAGMFMPMAEHFGFSEQLDKLVIQKIIPFLEKYKNTMFAVNISNMSLSNQEFISWFRKKMELMEHSSRIIVEIRESELLKNSNVLENIDLLGQNIAGVALEHFGARLPDFSYLKKINFKYIKLASRYINDIENNEATQFYLQTLIQMAHGLDIPVLAESVEVEITDTVIRSLNMDGAQGFYYGIPEALN
ncbi:MAG: EAL domain-containing protein [Gammaproteobacteria bacterium]|nr:EAL domain-containing protein [Gammaproteobacteria bacterium]